jgi:hypothetical protein
MLASSSTSSLRPSLAGRVRLHRDTTCSSARHSDHRGDEAGPTRREALKATLASLALMAAGPQAALAEGGAREGEVSRYGLPHDSQSLVVFLPHLT